MEALEIEGVEGLEKRTKYFIKTAKGILGLKLEQLEVPESIEEQKMEPLTGVVYFNKDVFTDKIDLSTIESPSNMFEAKKALIGTDKISKFRITGLYRSK